MAKKQRRPASMDFDPPPPRDLVRHTGPNRQQRRHGLWQRPDRKRFTIPRHLRMPALNRPYRRPVITTGHPEATGG